MACSLAGVLACGQDHVPRRESTEPTVEPTVAPSVAAPDAGGAPAPPVPRGVGTIQGKVLFTGPRPPPVALRRDQDAFCARTPMNDESLRVGDGGALADVAVYLTSAPAGAAAAPVPAAPIVLEQTACMYRPRVQTARLGQSLEIRNGDATLHNVHGYFDRQTLFNQAQIAAAAPIVRTLDEPGLVTFKCDVHAWMRAWVLVLPHPFSAVTGETGGFTLEGVPAGEHTVEAWHDGLGKKSQRVTVPAGGRAEVTFSFAAP